MVGTLGTSGTSGTSGTRNELTLAIFVQAKLRRAIQRATECLTYLSYQSYLTYLTYASLPPRYFLKLHSVETVRT